jgi:hypothetical protein
MHVIGRLIRGLDPSSVPLNATAAKSYLRRALQNALTSQWRSRKREVIDDDVARGGHIGPAGVDSTADDAIDLERVREQLAKAEQKLFGQIAPSVAAAMRPGDGARFLADIKNLRAVAQGRETIAAWAAREQALTPERDVKTARNGVDQRSRRALSRLWRAIDRLAVDSQVGADELAALREAHNNLRPQAARTRGG